MNELGPGGQTLDGQTVQVAVLAVMRLFRALERVDTGLTPQQYRILKLAGAGGERSARLAERMAVAKPTLTATADALVAAGYAQREAEAGDRPRCPRSRLRRLRRMAGPAAQRHRRRGGGDRGPGSPRRRDG